MRKPRVLLAVPVALLVVACGADAMPPEVGERDPVPTVAGTSERPPARAAAGVRLVRVAGFDGPLLVTAPRTDRRRIYVVEQGGRVMVVRDGRKLARPFLDISDQVEVSYEQGMLGLAFAPDFARSRRFYVYFTAKDGSQRVVEYRAPGADRADRASARLVLRMADSESNHNGGNLVFGPDGYLYIGTGDGGGANDRHGARGNAQNLGSLLGKILRIDPRRRGGRPYTSPASNPFRGRGRPEVYAYGLRNPWRFSFDRSTGALSIGDVGQGAVEEIDYVARGAGRGANFGWRPFEGNRRNYDEPAPGHVPPVITHTHDSGFCSITGGVVARDPRVPALRGWYVYGDICQDRIWRARLAPGRATRVGRMSLRPVSTLSSFGEDARGRVYVVSLDGPVYRFAAR